MKIPKQEYTVEFKELAVKRVRDGQAVGAVAKELGLIEQTLRNWVKAHAAGKLNAPGARKITPEEMELSRLRAKNIRLRRECEILKKRRHTSQKMRCEVCLDRHAAQALRPVRDVSRTERQHRRLPRLETRRQVQPETSATPSCWR